MGERGRRLDSGNNQKSDSDESDSYYSDDDYCCVSGYLPAISTHSTNTEGRSHKAQKLKTLVHYQASKHPAAKYARNKKEMCSQSLNRESPLKELPSLVTKRVLSSYRLKISELRNEMTELHLKLEEEHKENRSLKELQYKHEKTILKFEAAANKVSPLLARQSEEIRVLQERLRKSQGSKLTTERKLTTVEDELYKTKDALEKLTRLTEDKELPLRKQLTKKVTSLEEKLADNEYRIKNLEKNIGLNSKSFQRQLLSEKRKLDEAQEINKGLQEEIERLNNKIKEKERLLEATNIYTNRMPKPPPRRDIKITPRIKAVARNTKREQQTTKGVQPTGYFSPAEFPPPPDLISDPVSEENKDLHIKTDKIVEEPKEQAEHFRQRKMRENEERLKSDQELQALKETEWKREESERRKEENSILLERENKAKMDTEIYVLEKELQKSQKVEESRQKEKLLMKMYEIDRKTQINTKLASQTSTSDTTITAHSLEKSGRPFQFSETAEKISNGSLENDKHSGVTKGEIQKQRDVGAAHSSSDLTFGNYVPSFGKGSRRPSRLNPKSDVLGETPKENVDISIKRNKKSDLMEQLFGSSAIPVASSETNDLNSFVQEKVSNGSLENDKHSGVTKGEIQKQRDVGAAHSSSDLTFGTYVPSIGKGYRSRLNKKSDVLKETPKENIDITIKRNKKANLVEQLFGSSATPITSSKTNDLDSFVQDSSTDSFPQDKRYKLKDDSDIFFSEGKSFNPKKHRLQHTASRTAVEDINYSEEEIEEVLLQ